MPTFVGKIKNDQIILASAVSVPGGVEPPEKSYHSLLDTGAQRTLISEKIVKEVGLSAVGQARVVPASGQPMLVKTYRVRITIPITLRVTLPDGNPGMETYFQGKDMDVLSLPYQPTNHDVLLGMDLLAQFHLTMYGKSFILSN